MGFDDSLYNRQPDPRALDFVATLERLKDLPDPILRVGRNSGTVVRDLEIVVVRFICAADVDLRGIRAAMFDRIGKKIHHDLLERYALRIDRRQIRLDGNGYPRRRIQNRESTRLNSSH